jgi:hypothetical protein
MWLDVSNFVGACFTALKVRDGGFFGQRERLRLSFVFRFCKPQGSDLTILLLYVPGDFYIVPERRHRAVNMSKTSVFTTITPLPPGVSREVVIDTYHNHTEMIDLNPLVIERVPCKAPSFATADEFYASWYTIKGIS